MNTSKARFAAVLLSAAVIFSGCGATEIQPKEPAPSAVPAMQTETSAETVTGKTVPEYTGTTQAAAEPADSSESLSEAERLLSEMSLEQKVGQLFVIRPEQLAGSISEDSIGNSSEDGMTAVSEDMTEFAAKYHIGGYALFARNVKSPKQLKRLTSDLKEISEIPPMLLIDEEGGDVSRIAGNVKFPDLPVYPNMHYIGETGDTELAKKAGADIGGYLAEYGFTGDLAPVADINSNPYNVVIGERAFGDNKDTVSDMVSAFADGLHSAGISCCLKHFPGHGDTFSDTHDGTVTVDKSWEELSRQELVPFVENMGKADMIMTAHITLENVSSDGLPASLSKEIITDRLRGELGYDGLIITDALAMSAVTEPYGSGTAAVMAFEAGNDILLMPESIKQAYGALLEAVRNSEISMERLDESVLRILRYKLER